MAASLRAVPSAAAGPCGSEVAAVVTGLEPRAAVQTLSGAALERHEVGLRAALPLAAAATEAVAGAVGAIEPEAAAAAIEELAPGELADLALPGEPLAAAEPAGAAAWEGAPPPEA
ncbi:MAG TPA: hypothetical protein VED02_02580 [Methyloceanibacter sp.]|nr:hypothetical protein [Methyloceanibacter sp.]